MYLNVKEHKGKLYITELNKDYTLDFFIEKEFKPKAYQITDNNTKYKSLIENYNLDEITFNSVYDYKEFNYQNKDHSPDIFGNIQTQYQYISEKYYQKESKKYKPRYWYLDIETGIPDEGFPDPEKATEPITLIQIKESDTNTVYLFSFNKEYTRNRDDVKYLSFNTEQEMLEAFITFNSYRTPFVTTAWNADGFDFPYIVNRMEKIGVDYKKLSPFGIMEEHKSVIFGKFTKIKKPLGIIWVDMIECYKKSDPSGKESFTLDYMSKYILGNEEGGKLNYKISGYKNMVDFVKGKYNPKLDNKESLLKKYYQNNQQKFEQEQWNVFVDYGIVDVEILKKIDNKLGLMNVLLNVSQTMGVNVYDIFGTVTPWQIYIYNRLKKDNFFLNSKSPFDYYHVVGGYVFANPGIHRWIISEDYTSLYPFCMMALNISPETYIKRENVPLELIEISEELYRKENCEDILLNFTKEKKNRLTSLLLKHGLSMSPNGIFFKSVKTHGFGYLPELTNDIFQERKYHKKLMKEAERKVEIKKLNGEQYETDLSMVNVSNTEQYTRKILINSEYGFLANKHSNISNGDMGNAITSFGRYNLKRTSKYVVDKLNDMDKSFNAYITVKDTDSFYLCLDSIVDKFKIKKQDLNNHDIVEFLDKFAKKVIQPLIDESSKQISELLNTNNCLSMDKEIIADSMLILAKKKYTARVLDDEGVRLKDPKLKIIGIEIKRSDASALARKKLKKIISIIFDENNSKLIKYINECKDILRSSHIDEISIPTGVTDIEKFVSSPNLSRPMHIRASIIHNEFVKSKKLNYNKITNGDKIKYVFLKKNNIIDSDIIAFNDSDLIYETGLNKHIDYDRLFERTFIKPIEKMTNPIKWKTNKSELVSKLF